jgi:hypothetical protein
MKTYQNKKITVNLFTQPVNLEAVALKPREDSYMLQVAKS